MNIMWVNGSLAFTCGKPPVVDVGFMNGGGLGKHHCSSFQGVGVKGCDGDIGSGMVVVGERQQAIFVVVADGGDAIERSIAIVGISSEPTFVGRFS